MNMKGMLEMLHWVSLNSNASTVRGGQTEETTYEVILVPTHINARGKSAVTQNTSVGTPYSTCPDFLMVFTNRSNPGLIISQISLSRPRFSRGYK
jgi:hypothetical protein